MVRKTKTLNKTTLYVNKVLVGWVKEVEFELDYENEQEATHDGKMTRNTRFPGGEITLNKLTKFDAVEENAFLAAFDSIAEEGGTITMTTKEPRGMLTVNAYGVTMDSEDWTNEANQFLEVECTLQAEEIERYFT